jgi:hypothetical protein
VIKLLQNLPDNVVGVEPSGRVEAEDYREVRDPAVAKARETHDKVRLLAVRGDDYEGSSLGAAWEDTKLGIGHWGAWERIAVVTDHKGIRDAIGAIGWMLPGETKVFPTAERDEATAWVTGA